MTSRIPYAFVLHPVEIERLARGPAFARGRAYAREGRVVELERAPGRVVGTVRGTDSYAVSLWVKGDGLGYACTCPAAVEGDFCKH